MTRYSVDAEEYELTLLQEELLLAMLTPQTIARTIVAALTATYGPGASSDDDRLREAVRDLKALEAQGLCDLGGAFR